MHADTSSLMDSGSSQCGWQSVPCLLLRVSIYSADGHNTSLMLAVRLVSWYGDLSSLYNVALVMVVREMCLLLKCVMVIPYVSITSNLIGTVGVSGPWCVCATVHW